MAVSGGGQISQMVINQVSNSQVEDVSVTATSTSTQTQGMSGDQVAALAALLPDLRSLLDDVDEEDRAIAEAQVATIESQVASGHPVPAIVMHAALALEQVSYSVAGAAVFETLRGIIGA